MNTYWHLLHFPFPTSSIHMIWMKRLLVMMHDPHLNNCHTVNTCRCRCLNVRNSTALNQCPCICLVISLRWRVMAVDRWRWEDIEGDDRILFTKFICHTSSVASSINGTSTKVAAQFILPLDVLTYMCPTIFYVLLLLSSFLSSPSLVARRKYLSYLLSPFFDRLSLLILHKECRFFLAWLSNTHHTHATTHTTQTKYQSTHTPHTHIAQSNMRNALDACWMGDASPLECLPLLANAFSLTSSLIFERNKRRTKHLENKKKKKKGEEKEKKGKEKWVPFNLLSEKMLCAILILSGPVCLSLLSSLFLSSRQEMKSLLLASTCANVWSYTLTSRLTSHLCTVWACNHRSRGKSVTWFVSLLRLVVQILLFFPIILLIYTHRCIFPSLYSRFSRWERKRLLFVIQE